MRLRILFLLFLFLSGSGLAQVTIRLDVLPARYTPAMDTLYVAGNFNDWNPRSHAHRFMKNAFGQWETQIATSLASLEYKITRGNWATVEVAASGQDIPNRSLSNMPGSVVAIQVADWADTKGTHTATANVSILTSQLWLAPLKRYRRIWICLPPGYEANDTTRYPVAYFHDGQNVFDAATSFSGEWKVDEALNQLAQSAGWQPVIAVAIDNGGGERINELTPFRHSTYGGGQGELYGQSVVECVKPLIDSLFRTRKEAEHTAICGSSLGGIESLYMGFALPGVFSKVLAFSPSLWFSDSLQNFLLAQPTPLQSRIYFLCGTNEGDPDMVPDMNSCYTALVASGYPPNSITKQVISGGTHSEGFWSQHVKAGLQWLFTETTPVKKNENRVGEPFQIQVQEEKIVLKLTEDEHHTGFIQLSDAYGRIMAMERFSGSYWASRPLVPGVYTIRIFCTTGVFTKRLIR